MTGLCISQAPIVSSIITFAISISILSRDACIDQSSTFDTIASAEALDRTHLGRQHNLGMSEIVEASDV